MSADNPFAPGNAMELGKQFWDAWTEFAQGQARAQGPAAGMPFGSGAGAAAAMPNWQEGFELWSRLAGNPPSANAANAVEQMTQHGQRLMQMMQAMASGTAGGNAPTASDIAEAWKNMLGGSNPMLDTLRELQGQGARGWEQLGQGFEPILSLLRGERAAWLGMPALGYNRERQQHQQALLQAQADYADRAAAYATLLGKASEQGLALFQRKLAERSEPGRQIDSMRALYDLWIDAAEEAYAEAALSPEFRKTYGAMVNAQMRMKQLLQQELDHQVGQLGLPTRAELDGAHRKIHGLQRDLRALREQLGGSAERGADSRQSTPPASRGRRAPAKKPTAPARARRSAVEQEPDVAAAGVLGGNPVSRARPLAKAAHRARSASGPSELTPAAGAASRGTGKAAKPRDQRAAPSRKRSGGDDAGSTSGRASPAARRSASKAAPRRAREE